ncbi:MAG: prephenate dehydrogenase/arogenate dehydrogenase family protein, partial [Kiritimatiellia bacterium]
DVEFIAAHPMAGREVYGVQNSDEQIFRGANYIVTPTARNTEAAVQDCLELGRLMGFAHVSVLSPEKHDEMIGFVSQLTHCIAVSLMTCYDGEKLQDYTGDSFRDDVDLLVVATASGAHDEAVFAAAARRLPVLVEKPLAITAARIDALAAACAATGTPLGCICQTRWTPAFQATRAAVEAGRLGRITFARVDVPWWREDAYYTESGWHGTWAMDGGGALMNQSIHMIDWLTALMPPVEEVRGFAATLAHPMETEDTACAAIRFAGGALGTVYGATSSWPGRPKTLEITGTKGTIVLRDHAIAEWSLADGTPPPVGASGEAAPHGSNRPDQLDCSLHRACFEAFADSLDGGAPYPIDAAAARRSVSLIEQIIHADAS